MAGAGGQHVCGPKRLHLQSAGHRHRAPHDHGTPAAMRGGGPGSSAGPAGRLLAGVGVAECLAQPGLELPRAAACLLHRAAALRQELRGLLYQRVQRSAAGHHHPLHPHLPAGDVQRAAGERASVGTGAVAAADGGDRAGRVRGVLDATLLAAAGGCGLLAAALPPALPGGLVHRAGRAQLGTQPAHLHAVQP